MSKQIKRIKFAKAKYGVSWLDIDINRWIVTDACGASRCLVGLACRIAERGTRFEYRSGAAYVRINDDIEIVG